jgi:hypothetical protein
MALFAAPDSGGLEQLWITDGTGAGTTEVPVAGVSGGLDPSQFAPLGSLALFDATTGGSVSEWVTDGTGAGTSELSVPNSEAFSGGQLAG